MPNEFLTPDEIKKLQEGNSNGISESEMSQIESQISDKNIVLLVEGYHVDTNTDKEGEVFSIKIHPDLDGVSQAHLIARCVASMTKVLVQICQNNDISKEEIEKIMFDSDIDEI